MSEVDFPHVPQPLVSTTCITAVVVLVVVSSSSLNSTNGFVFLVNVLLLSDDVVFVIYLYQRFKYPVDHKRAVAIEDTAG